MSTPVTDRRRQLRRDVERIAARVARRRHVDLADLLGSKRGHEFEVARRAAIRKIAAQTGCTATELAWAWGCGFGMVQRALERATPHKRAAPRRKAEAPPQPPKTKPVYDDRTVDRLHWQYGPVRTLDILNGIDPATNADLAAWRRLGSAFA
jgi:hypothetical protein